ncbi:MAG TPA: rhomboid family intramembrane serine protease [Terriglobia bacterium]|nr:rhomboid family intramembrane serine protease [Terriglobia bacterium]
MVEERDLEFWHAFRTRPVVVTYGFFALNILIFLLMSLAGGTENEATLLAFGVKANAQIDQGEIWRFVTPVFIHIGILHILFNSYAIWIIGPTVEKLYGGARFTLIYLVTGIAGVYGSYWYHPRDISAGASGAIFGLFGALLVFGLKYRSSIPPMFQKAVGKGVLQVVVINLVIGFLPGIDNSAHVSGLIMGAIVAAVIPYQRPGSSTSSAFKIIQAALAIVVLLSFYEVVVHYNGPAISFRNLSRIVE